MDRFKRDLRVYTAKDQVPIPNFETRNCPTLVTRPASIQRCRSKLPRWSVWIAVTSEPEGMHFARQRTNGANGGEGGAPYAPKKQCADSTLRGFGTKSEVRFILLFLKPPSFTFGNNSFYEDSDLRAGR